MGQSSSQNQTDQIQRKPQLHFPKSSQNYQTQKRFQSIRTEEDEKNFYEDYEIVKRINDDYLGDCVIMREKNLRIDVCVKDHAAQNRDQMRTIQQNLLKNYNCYNNEDDESQDYMKNQKNKYHKNLISVVRVVKAKDELDFFLCSQQFRVIYALEYSEQNLSNYFSNNEQNQLLEEDIWNMLEQLSGALLFLQNQGKYHGNLSSQSIYIMPTISQLNEFNRQQNKFNDNIQQQEHDFHNNFKWFKIAENELVRCLPMFDRISQRLYNINKKKRNGIIADNLDKQYFKGCYLSPEQIDDINSIKYKSSMDGHKSDIFTLGCVILEIMGKSLTKYKMNVSMDGVFEYGQINHDKTLLFHNEKLISKIEMIMKSRLYSDNLMNLIKVMVQVDQMKRPDCRELVITLEKLGRFNTPINTQIINQQNASFNMTKSVQFNSLNSSKKINPLVGFGNAESCEKMENGESQSFLDCIQQLQKNDTQIQVESIQDDFPLFQNSPFIKKSYQNLQKQENIIITPLNNEINYTQEMMKIDAPDENNYTQYNQNNNQNDFKNKIRITSIKTSLKNKSINQTPLTINQLNLKEIKEMSEENDSTLPSNKNKEHSLNSSQVSHPKTSRNILQENKNYLNIQERALENNPINKQNQSYSSQNNNIINYKYDNFDNDVYAMIDANYKKNINNYQHKRSNSTTLSISNNKEYHHYHPQPFQINLEQLKNNNDLQQYNSNLSSITSRNQLQNQDKLRSTNSIHNFIRIEGEKLSPMKKDTEKQLNYSYLSSNTKSNCLQENIVPLIKSSRQEYNNYKSLGIQDNNNQLLQSKPLIQNNYASYQNNNLNNQKDLNQEIQYMKGFKQENGFQKKHQGIQNLKQELIEKLKKSNSNDSKQQQYPFNNSQSYLVNNNNNFNKQPQLISPGNTFDKPQKMLNINDNEIKKSVQIDNNEISFREEKDQQLSNRSHLTHRIQQQQNQNQHIYNSNFQSNPLNNSNISPQYEQKYMNSRNSVNILTPDIQKHQRSSSLCLNQERDQKISYLPIQINKININSNSNFNSVNHTPRTYEMNMQINSTKDQQNKLIPLLNMDQLQKDIEKRDILLQENEQNTESILECSLMNDQRIGNSTINYNQQQLFTYSTGTLPSSTRNGCKRRTQSSFINDSALNQYSLLQPHSLNLTTLHTHHSDNIFVLEQTPTSLNSAILQKPLNWTQQNSFIAKNQKAELETVQELKESYFNQTINLSNRKQADQQSYRNIKEINSSTRIEQQNNSITQLSQQKQQSQQNQDDSISLQKQYSQRNILSQRNTEVQKQKDDESNSVQKQKEYVFEKYEDGAYYQGENWGSLRWGLGKFVYADGACFEGEWERGQMNGFGKLYYPSGNLAYEGKWKDDKFDGRGVIYNEKPILLEKGTEVDYQNFNNMTEEWIKFDGEFKIDEKDGFGTFYFSNGSKFQCTFVDDMAQGVGTFTFSDSCSQIVGEWKENILVNTFKQK